MRGLLPRSCQLAGTHYRSCMIPLGSTGRAHQIVVAMTTIDLGPLTDSQARATKDVAAGSDQTLGIGIKLLNDHAGETLMVHSPVIEHIDEPRTPILIMEEGGVEAGSRYKDRIGPGSGNGRGSDNVVQRVLIYGPGLYIGEDEPVQSLGIGEMRRPDSPRIRIPHQVDLAGPGQGRAHPLPVHQVCRVIYVDPRPPFKGGIGYVIVLPHL